MGTTQTRKFKLDCMENGEAVLVWSDPKNERTKGSAVLRVDEDLDKAVTAFSENGDVSNGNVFNSLDWRCNEKRGTTSRCPKTAKNQACICLPLQPTACRSGSNYLPVTVSRNEAQSVPRDIVQFLASCMPKYTLAKRMKECESKVKGATDPIQQTAVTSERSNSIERRNSFDDRRNSFSGRSNSNPGNGFRDSLYSRRSSDAKLFPRRNTLRSSRSSLPIIDMNVDDFNGLGDSTAMTESDIQKRIKQAVNAANRDIGELRIQNAELENRVNNADVEKHKATEMYTTANYKLEQMELKARILQQELENAHILLRDQNWRHLADAKKKQTEVERAKEATIRFEEEIKKHKDDKARVEKLLLKTMEEHRNEIIAMEEKIKEHVRQIKELQEDAKLLATDKKEAAQALINAEIRELAILLEEEKTKNAALQSQITKMDQLLDENVKGFSEEREKFHQSKEDLDFFMKIISKVYKTESASGEQKEDSKLNLLEVKDAMEKCTDAVKVKTLLNGGREVSFETSMLTSKTYQKFSL